MPVATMDDLRSMTVGETIIVDSAALGPQEWTRHAEGWERDGVVAGDGNFLGYVSAGLVTRTTPAEPTPAPTIPEELIEDLNEYAVNARSDSFDRILDRHGIDRRTSVAVRVRLTGTVSWTPGVAMAAAGLLGSGFTVMEVEGAVIVRWERLVTVVKRGIGCQCDEVVAEDWREFLPDDYDLMDESIEGCDQD